MKKLNRQWTDLLPINFKIVEFVYLHGNMIKKSNKANVSMEKTDAKLQLGMALSSHAITDIYASFILGMIPVLAVKFNLSIFLVSLLTSISGISNSLTQPLFGFLSDKYGGSKIIKSYFEKSEAKDDGVELLKDTLAEMTTTFAEQYSIFLASLRELTEAEEAQALLSLDPIAAMAASDAEKVDELLRMIQTDDERVMQHLADLAKENGLDYGQAEQGDAEPQIDRAAELLEKWQVQPGDLWQIGEHRLICGDCTDAGIIDRLMEGGKADVVFTDPPYNIAGNFDVHAKDLRDSYKELKEADWDQDFDITQLFRVIDSLLAADASVYVCSAQPFIDLIWQWMNTWGDHVSYVVWCKGNPMPALSKRHWCLWP